jgi:glycine cleavage system H protein
VFKARPLSSRIFPSGDVIMIKFTKDHEWIRVEGDTATVGITTYAQSQLGDVVFVEVPEAGRALTQGKDAAVVESVKAASEVYAPVDGTVIKGNQALADDPSLVNTAPETDGWFFTMKIADPAQLDGLMDEAAYTSYVEGL